MSFGVLSDYKLSRLDWLYLLQDRIEVLYVFPVPSRSLSPGFWCCYLTIEGDRDLINFYTRYTLLNDTKCLSTSSTVFSARDFSILLGLSGTLGLLSLLGSLGMRGFWR